jgi:hypothetical protein
MTQRSPLVRYLRLGRSGGFLAAARLPPGPISVIGEPGWCVLHQSRASERLLNFIGAMSGPVTMKSPLTTRMVSVVIAPPYPNDRTKAEARDRAFRLLRTR